MLLSKERHYILVFHTHILFHFICILLRCNSHHSNTQIYTIVILLMLKLMLEAHFEYDMISNLVNQFLQVDAPNFLKIVIF